MAGLFVVSLLLLDHSQPSFAQGLPAPRQMPTSNRVYGPDGPWQAISIQLGLPAQNLDLYPGGIYQSKIFTDQLCKDTQTLPCGSGGLYSPESSETFDDHSIDYGQESSGISSLWTDGAMLFSYSNSKNILEQLQIAGTTVAKFSLTMYPQVTVVYPDGDYPLQVGELALGPTTNQSVGYPNGSPSLNASLVPGNLKSQNAIPSNSFGLHIGIAAEVLRLSLSLWLGGYDASRIVGPVSSQSTQNFLFAIDLLDVGIGVNHGGSPFSSSLQQGLLSQGNSSITSTGISVTLNPSAPYLYLPNSTCAAITENLPVTYNVGKALYFWNTADPRYANIVTSPTYLSFVFRGSSGNLTINTPFQLLNLTLGLPLVPTNTPYFPCQPPQGPEGNYSLRRAFLQAAFIGVNWAISGESEWYLAQAPGPNTDTNPQVKPYTDASPIGLEKEWADSWSDFWTTLPTSTSTSIHASKTASATSSDLQTPASSASEYSTARTRSLSGGAIAGIAIAGACAASIIAGISVCLLRRRRDGHPGMVQHSTINPSNTHIPSHSLPSRHQIMESEIGDSVGADDPIRFELEGSGHCSELP